MQLDTDAHALTFERTNTHLLLPHANGSLLVAVPFFFFNTQRELKKIAFFPFFSILWNLSCSVGAVIARTVCANVCNLLCNTSIMMDIAPPPCFQGFYTSLQGNPSFLVRQPV